MLSNWKNFCGHKIWCIFRCGPIILGCACLSFVLQKILIEGLYYELTEVARVNILILSVSETNVFQSSFLGFCLTHVLVLYS